MASDACEVGFQHMTDRHYHTVNAIMKQKGQEKGGEDESEICIAVRRSLNSLQKQVIITNYL
jgi:hypothetical protein